MRVHIDLKKIKIDNIRFVDETLVHQNNKQIVLWDKMLDGLEQRFDLASNLFFQDEITVDNTLIKELGLNIENIEDKFAELLFNNIPMTKVLKNTFNVRYDQISVISEPGNETQSGEYSINNSEYVLLDKKNLFDFARDVYAQYNSDVGLGDIVSEISDIFSFLDYINDKEYLFSLTNQHLSTKGITQPSYSRDIDDNIVQAFKMLDDFETITSMIDENSMIDWVKYAKDNVNDFEYAVDILQPILGDYISSGKTTIFGKETKEFLIFENM